ncbi:hypothetical protein BMF94_5385 [Rhodotorula taiwanensis]|uniref:Uncharacterized protein n=1 Tax=Rhodotorula taiwanensis TaxID=741276 RepID=A0A2S5B495_9BASI|nr:hypothetical protein BMF94_5385 [Rhodotorula taiwanensis]
MPPQPLSEPEGGVVGRSIQQEIAIWGGQAHYLSAIAREQSGHDPAALEKLEALFGHGRAALVGQLHAVVAMIDQHTNEGDTRQAGGSDWYPPVGTMHIGAGTGRDGESKLADSNSTPGRRQVPTGGLRLGARTELVWPDRSHDREPVHLVAGPLFARERTITAKDHPGRIHWPLGWGSRQPLSQTGDADYPLLEAGRRIGRPYFLTNLTTGQQFGLHVKQEGHLLKRLYVSRSGPPPYAAVAVEHLQLVSWLVRFSDLDRDSQEPPLWVRLDFDAGYFNPHVPVARDGPVAVLAS